MAKLHVESVYGLYHGQDPRTFDPDDECCTEAELQAHAAAVEMANKSGWHGDDTDSGCKHVNLGTSQAIICKSSYGVGTYEVVIDDEGGFVRDATYSDIQQEGDWEEDI